MATKKAKKKQASQAPTSPVHPDYRSTITGTWNVGPEAAAALRQAVEHMDFMRSAFRKLPPVTGDELRLRLRASIELNTVQSLVERALLVLS